MNVRILGRFEADLDGQPISIPSRNSQSLLAFLLLHPGVQHRREQIAGTLWPDVPEDDARRRLRYALWQLRKTLGAQLFEASRLELGLSSEADVRVDYLDILSEVETLDRLKAQVDIYQGELLPGFYDEWVSTFRRKALVTFDSLAYRLLSALAEQEQWQAMLHYAEHWINFGEANEPAYRALIVAHAQLGDTGAATAAFERCRERLESDLGVEPAAETVNLYKQVKAGDKPMHFEEGGPAPSRLDDLGSREPPGFLEIESGEAAPTADHLVAREGELAALREQLASSVEGNGRVVFISGQAGSGKSSLLKRFGELAQKWQVGLLITTGRAEAHSGSAEPFLPFRDALAHLTGDVEASWRSGDLSAEAARKLWESIPFTLQALLDHGEELIGTFLHGRTLLTELNRRLDPGDALMLRFKDVLQHSGMEVVPVDIDHGDMRQRLLNQYTRLIQEISVNQPLLMMIDDFQWADQGSLDLLFHLGRRLDGHPAILVVAYRPEELGAEGGQNSSLSKVIAELQRTYGEPEFNLDQVGTEAGRELVDGILDAETNRFSSDFRASLYRRTQGHPLFTVELVKQLRLSGSIKQDKDGVWELSQGFEWDQVPVRVEAVIAGRVDRLSGDLVRLLQIAAVEGETFAAETLAAVSQTPDFTVVSTLSRELDRKHQIIEALEPSRVGGRRISRYRFRHVLFQEYLYQQLDAVERAYLHEQVGEALEALFEKEPEGVVAQLARHFSCSGDAEKSASYALQAARQARRMSAHHEIIALLTDALWHIRRIKDLTLCVQLEVEARLTLGAALLAIEGYTSHKVERTYEAARRLAEVHGDARQLAQSWWGLWSYFVSKGDMSLTIDLARTIDTRAKEEGDPSLELVADWSVGLTQLFRGELSEAEHRLGLALVALESGTMDHLRLIFGQDPETTCRIYYAYAKSQAGEYELGTTEAEKAVKRAEAIKDDFTRAFAYGMAGVLHASRGEVEKTAELARQAVRYSKAGGFPFLMGVALTTRGWSVAKLGNSRRGIDLFRHGLDAMEMTGAAIGRTFMLVLFAEILLDDGQVDQAREVIEQAYDLCRKNDDGLFAAEIARLQAEVCIREAGSEDEIRSLLDRSLNLAHQTGSRLTALKTAITRCRHSTESAPDCDELKSLLSECSDEMPIPPLQDARALIKD